MSLITAILKSNNFEKCDSLDVDLLQPPELRILLDRQHLKQFRAAVGWHHEVQLPPTYLQVLANSQVKKILTHPAFPFSPLGIVHIENAISVFSDVNISRELHCRCSLTAFSQHPRGISFSVNVDVSQQELLVYRAECNMLCIDKRKNTVRKVSPHVAGFTQTNELWGGSIPMEFPADIGRRYGRLSGDYNPIHLTAITARLFGFKRAIAHGMYAKAVCLSQIDKSLTLPTAYQVKVKFKKPLLLPTEAALQLQEGAHSSSCKFILSCQGMGCMEGAISAIN